MFFYSFSMVYMGHIEICVPGVFKLHCNIALFSMLLKSFLMSHNSLCNVRNPLHVSHVDFVPFFFFYLVINFFTLASFLLKFTNTGKYLLEPLAIIFVPLQPCYQNFQDLAYITSDEYLAAKNELIRAPLYMQVAQFYSPIKYPKPDGVLSFDILTSLHRYLKTDSFVLYSCLSYLKIAMEQVREVAPCQHMLYSRDFHHHTSPASALGHM